MLDLSALDFDKHGGTVIVVAQDAQSGGVLMVAHADREALERTIETGEMHYRSRSRGLWHKGATSGNRQRVVSLTADCDGDAVLARVAVLGPACHTGRMSCFGEAGEIAGAIGRLDRVIAERSGMAREESRARGAPPELHDETARTPVQHPSAAPASYTQRLLADRNLRLKKIGEEAAELVTACADGDRARAAEEGADLLYHALVALRSLGVTLADVQHILAARARPRDTR